MCIQATTLAGFSWQGYEAARRGELSRKAPKRETESTRLPVSCRQQSEDYRVRQGAHGRRMRN